MVYQCFHYLCTATDTGTDTGTASGTDTGTASGTDTGTASASAHACVFTVMSVALALTLPVPALTLPVPVALCNMAVGLARWEPWAGNYWHCATLALPVALHSRRRVSSCVCTGTALLVAP